MSTSWKSVHEVDSEANAGKEYCQSPSLRARPSGGSGFQAKLVKAGGSQRVGGQRKLPGKADDSHLEEEEEEEEDEDISETCHSVGRPAVAMIPVLASRPIQPRDLYPHIILSHPSCLRDDQRKNHHSAAQMAWDSKTTRRRGSSNVAVRPLKPSIATIEPKSAHVADPTLQPFLASSFDPAGYLNSNLPPLKAPSISSKDALPLAELSTQTQTLLSQLSAHTTRLTNTLTQLTDEILRSGSRLAYEVEILRGETLGLSEALTEGLREDVVKFVPGGLEQELLKKQSTGNRRRSSVAAPKAPLVEEAPKVIDPPYITQLRTLTLVRSRLDMVIKTFGDAMEWTFPPSEVSVSSSFLSVSAPEPGSEQHSTEEKGQQVSRKLREEIADLLIGDDPIDAIEAAAKRVGELKELAVVWKGTAEEKARIKFVESLAKLVEERHRDLLREAEKDTGLRQRVETLQEEKEPSAGDSKLSGGYGFISQLQKFRGAS